MRINLLVSVLLPGLLCAQLLDPSKLLRPPVDTWPTYNGDYSGRRFSPLRQINDANLNDLALKWIYRANAGPMRGIANVQIKSTPLEVNGILYFTVPDNVWAVDARTGEELWHYNWVDHGGHLVGNRGVGMYGSWLYFLAPDGWFISLNAINGTERWRLQVADTKLQYFTTMAPLVIRNHVIIGVGGDAMDVPGYLEARDPETGALQWRWNSEPRAGQPGAETWPNAGAMEHGGGMTWLPGTYDPELNLLYWGTGNPNPVYAGQGRKGSNLWTCSIVALDPDKGKLVWYFQASPHDTHDWDDVETPVLLDAEFHGERRKLLAQAARNGYFFVLDRTTGKNLVSAPYTGTNWSRGTDSAGQPIPNPEKEPHPDGALLNINALGGTNWFPPSFDPDTGLFYVNATRGYSLAYLTDTEEKPEGYGGGGRSLWAQAVLEAIDCQSGKIRWSHEYPGKGLAGAGILTTAGRLLFTGDPSGNLIASDPLTGGILWHFRLQAPVSNGPMSYNLDGQQYLVVGAGDTLYAFSLLQGYHEIR
ncbi:MAG TPA: acido-empty-quinoprotein group A [Bryobacteraceae bacterium]|jgi:alcohol dehydrogenase (cytochrome c)|nr:acido-empty-quinoprotein group A [Bryobacteraceae bacterium]